MSISELGTSVDMTTKLALALSIVSLFLAGWSFIASFDDDRDTERIQQRLACLELPGTNDCGADGR
jgi:hypothetical protein